MDVCVFGLVHMLNFEKSSLFCAILRGKNMAGTMWSVWLLFGALILLADISSTGLAAIGLA